MLGKRKSGVVKWFDLKKKFGFITDDDTGEDCFVHKSELKGVTGLVTGEKVTFDMIETLKGRKALKVELA